MGPLKSNSSYTFDRPETIRDGAKMNLAGHRDRRLSENYFEPWIMTMRTYIFVLFKRQTLTRAWLVFQTSFYFCLKPETESNTEQKPKQKLNQNRKKFFATKTELKNGRNRKSKNTIPPFLKEVILMVSGALKSLNISKYSLSYFHDQKCTLNAFQFFCFHG